MEKKKLSIDIPHQNKLLDFTEPNTGYISTVNEYDFERLSLLINKQCQANDIKFSGPIIDDEVYTGENYSNEELFNSNLKELESLKKKRKYKEQTQLDDVVQKEIFMDLPKKNREFIEKRRKEIEEIQGNKNAIKYNKVIEEKIIMGKRFKIKISAIVKIKTFVNLMRINHVERK